MPGTGATRRILLIIVAAAFFIAILFVGSIRDATSITGRGSTFFLSQDTLHGDAIAPKLGNETLKAELGRAAWKVLHTTLARFPEKPTKDESEALRSYIHLFQRLYPCGDCAKHFGEVLKDFPPQVSSRNAAAGWGCHVHNQVNERLKKPLFDCANIGDFYDCGCADDEKDEKDEKDEEGREQDGPGKSDTEPERRDVLSGRGKGIKEDLHNLVRWA